MIIGHLITMIVVHESERDFGDDLLCVSHIMLERSKLIREPRKTTLHSPEDHKQTPTILIPDAMSLMPVSADGKCIRRRIVMIQGST